MKPSSRDLGLSSPSAVADEAMSYVGKHLPEFLVGHCARSFLFVRPTAAAQGLEPGRDYDEELVFLICLLHDLGLSEAGNGSHLDRVEHVVAQARQVVVVHQVGDRLVHQTGHV
ncbi:hypothetical protein ABT262_12700, partial [Amycolatopsis mediterranei]